MGIRKLYRNIRPSVSRAHHLYTITVGKPACRGAAGPGWRVRFAFDEGYFASSLGLRLPYPVPFRLLGKEAEGFLDTSYLSERLRVSRGNKGTTFLLRRKE